ncbi:MAG: sensor histidine kinase [Planctomycetota bacterium]
MAWASMGGLLPVAAAAVGAAAGWWWERRRLGPRVRSAQRRCHDLESGLENLQEGLFLLGPHDRVEFGNRAALSLLGAPSGPTPGESCVLARLGSPAALAETVARCPPDESVRRVIELAPPGGTARTLELIVIPTGEERRVLLLRDLEPGERLDRKRRDFVANASHELRTPIAAILGLLDLLGTPRPEAEHEDLLARARRNAERMHHLVRDLLDLARAEDPDWKLSPAAVKLADLASGVLEAHAQAAVAKGLELRSGVEPPGLELLTDPLALETILANLVENAVAYTSSGCVEVSIRSAPGAGAILEVHDNGPGIPAEVLPRIFERFFRVDAARSRASGGTGLGLALVRNLVARLGGRIAVRSRPGQGTTFRVELPRNPARPLPGAGQAEFK